MGGKEIIVAVQPIRFFRFSINPVLLNPDIPCLCKQCRSRSVGFWRSQLIWIFTVCHLVCVFISTTRIKSSDWLKMGSGCGILIYSAWQWLRGTLAWFSSIFTRETTFVTLCLLFWISSLFLKWDLLWKERINAPQRWSTLKGKNLFQKGRTFFPFRIDPFQKGCQFDKSCLPWKCSSFL